MMLTGYSLECGEDCDAQDGRQIVPISRGRANRTQHWVRLAAGLVLLGMAAYAVWQQRSEVGGQKSDVAARPAASPESVSPSDDSDRPGRSDHSRAATIIPSQTIHDLDGGVAHRGDVDVTATLERIKAGQLLRYSNDGATFQNRERRLPKEPPGYYKEYVHATPGLAGPRPQRIVVGEQGETYYTPDHYETFRRLD
jgi:filamentous hemagglutinin